MPCAAERNDFSDWVRQRIGRTSRRVGSLLELGGRVPQTENDSTGSQRSQDVARRVLRLRDVPEHEPRVHTIELTHGVAVERAFQVAQSARIVGPVLIRAIAVHGLLRAVV